MTYFVWGDNGVRNVREVTNGRPGTQGDDTVVVRLMTQDGYGLDSGAFYFADDETADTFTIDPSEYSASQVTTCHDCGVEVEDAILVFGYRYRDSDYGRRWAYGEDSFCHSHAFVCECCESGREMDRAIGDGNYCNECYFECDQCGVIGSNDDDYAGNGWCNDCATYCDDCGDYYLRDNGCCGNCEGSIRGLEGYHHTEPSGWLGGPLPRIRGHVDGYYLGWELEVTAQSGDAGVINRWSNRALGDHYFECKEDSSVAGFEIVTTHPMTRAYVDNHLAPRLPGFFQTLENEFGSPGTESREHGLHVHISRTAFRDANGVDSPAMLAAFCRILQANDGEHLERIARRTATHYCRKLERPVKAVHCQSAAYDRRREAQTRTRRGNREARIQLAYDEFISQPRPWDGYVNPTGELYNDRWESFRDAGAWEPIDPYDRQAIRNNMAWRIDSTDRRDADYVNSSHSDAINLTNPDTVEVRAFRSTRRPEDLLSALRTVSDVADYVRELGRSRKGYGKNATWIAFCRWAAINSPEMFPIYSNLVAVAA